MRMLLSLAACLITSALAVFPDEAYHVDYHHALLGFPQQQTTFFHQPHPNSKASLIYTLSERGVIGAVNPKDGSLIWRQFLSPDSSTIRGGFLKAGEGQNTVVSATSDIIAAWGASEGRLVWESRTRGAKIKDVEVLESNAIEAAEIKDIIAVIEHGHQTYVKRLDGKTGKTLWTYVDER